MTVAPLNTPRGLVFAKFLTVRGNKPKLHFRGRTICFGVVRERLKLVTDLLLEKRFWGAEALANTGKQAQRGPSSRAQLERLEVKVRSVRELGSKLAITQV